MDRLMQKVEERPIKPCTHPALCGDFFHQAVALPTLKGLAAIGLGCALPRHESGRVLSSAPRPIDKLEDGPSPGACAPPLLPKDYRERGYCADRLGMHILLNRTLRPASLHEALPVNH